jgi:hypothetical protein
MPPGPADRPHEPHYNRDEDMKPGRPPRPSSEPHGSEGSADNAKTLTDPATGAPQNTHPQPNTSDRTDDHP